MLYSFFFTVAKILIVDDEALVIHVISLALQSGGHQITVATSGREALDAAQSAEPIDVLIVDHSLPPHGGRDEIAGTYFGSASSMKVLHTSGYPRHHREAEGNISTSAGFIQKPFTTQAIRDAVATVFP